VEVASLVERQVARDLVNRRRRRHRPGSEAAVGLVVADRPRPRQEAIDEDSVAHLDPIAGTGARPDHLTRVLQPGTVGRLGQVLVLAAGHEEIDPPH
jgi:hypothetical protein